MEKVAICIRGAVSKRTGRFQREGEVYTVKGDYVNIDAVRRSIQRHVQDCNPSCSFDFYIHCWSTDLEDSLVDLYKPLKWKFEDNRLYADAIRAGVTTPAEFAQLSSVLSMGKSLELIDGDYDRIIMIRPDVLLWKDMRLHEYDTNAIYVNNWMDRRGDFHFVLSPQHSYIFKEMFHAALNGDTCFGEGWIKHRILRDGRFEYRSDSIRAGHDEEVLRQLRLVSIQRHGIQPAVFLDYGLTLDEIERYTVH
jgi:hypothetical protein